MKKKAYDHLSNAKKGFDKIQNLFMIKKLTTGIEEYLNITKAIYDKPTTITVKTPPKHH